MTSSPSFCLETFIIFSVILNKQSCAISASKNFCFANKAYQLSGTNEFNDSASLKEQTRRCFFKYLQYSRGVETMEEKKDAWSTFQRNYECATGTISAPVAINKGQIDKGARTLEIH